MTTMVTAPSEVRDAAYTASLLWSPVVEFSS